MSKKVSCPYNPVNIWRTALPPSPICRGIYLLPLWSSHLYVKHSQSPIIPTDPPLPLSSSSSFLTPPTHDTTASRPPAATAAPVLPLYQSLSSSSFFSSLPVTTIGAVARRRRLLCGFNTWYLNLAVLCRQALKRELWSRLHQGK